MDLTSTDCAELSGVSMRWVNTIYLRVRRRMGEHCEQVSPLGGELEADEPYFDLRRVRGLRGQGAGGKTVVFGLLKRGQNVYAEIVPNASKAVLQPIIRGKADIDSGIHTDRWRGYDGLVDVRFDKHLRVNHGNNKFARAVFMSTASNAFGATPSVVWCSSMACPAYVLPAPEKDGVPLNHRH